jgi:hypothetical protein
VANLRHVAVAYLFQNLSPTEQSRALQVAQAEVERQATRRLGVSHAQALAIGEFTLSPSSRRGASYSVTNGGAPTPYSIEKHALWCLLIEGQVLPIGRYASLEEALAAAISHMKHGKYVD